MPTVVEVEKIITKEVPKIVEVPVERVVIAPTPTCPECGAVVDNGLGACSACPLMARLNQPQAPSICSHSCVLENGQFKWVAAQMDTATVQVAHPQMDGWQKPCPVTVYVTCDGSEPSKSNYAFSGDPPLVFRIQRTLTVKALALSEVAGASVLVEASFTRLEPAGVGMLLEKMQGLKGIYVQEVIEGGVVWMDGTIEPGDEIKMIDNERVEHLELSAVTRLILGQAGSKVI